VLYPGCYIGAGCRLGDDCVLHPNVVIYDGCRLGNRVTIHAGSVIGEDGLGYAPVGGKWHKIPQIGVVEIGDDVEIGANCTIDRATLGKTLIASGTKLSNLIAIGHGAKIAEDCMLVAQVGIAGSTTVGRHVTMAGKAGVAGHLTIGDNARIGAMAGVMRDVPPNTEVLGAPAMEISECRRVMSVQARLPELRGRIRELESELAELRELLRNNGRGPSA
jgi:UDP-3-O-[3-hydroxymyristoyl] glucosamine N-acyltransferase